MSKTDWSRLWSAGQSVAQASAIKSAKTVVAEMAAGCWEALAGIGGVSAS